MNAKIIAVLFLSSCYVHLAAAIIPGIASILRPRPSTSNSKPTYYGSRTSSSSSRGSSSYSGSSASGGYFDSGSSYYKPPAPLTTTPAPFGSLRNQQIRTTDSRPCDFDPYVVGDNVVANISEILPLLTTELPPTSAASEPVVTPSPGNETGECRVNASSSNHTVYGNYYRHCAVPMGFGMAPSEQYIIYGLAPPPPSGFAYADFVATDTYDADADEIMNDTIRVFTDVCFFAINNQEENGRLRLTLKTPPNAYRWTTGCSLNIYSGRKDTDWSSAKSVLSMGSSSLSGATDAQTRSLIAWQPSIGVELQWGQDPTFSADQLNFTMVVEPIPAAYGSVRTSHTSTSNALPSEFEDYAPHYAAPTNAVPTSETTIPSNASSSPEHLVYTVYGNYYKHCLHSQGYTLNPGDSYVIYGLAPPQPDNVRYAEFATLDSSDGQRYRVFTESCFFSVNNKNDTQWLGVTMKMQCNGSDWQSGTSVSLSSGLNTTDWLTYISPFSYTISTNDCNNPQQTRIVEQPSIAIEIKWPYQEDLVALRDRLNFTITIESITPPPTTTGPMTTPETANDGVVGSLAVSSALSTAIVVLLSIISSYSLIW